ncbi:DUF4865 family protein [Lentzea sp.]|uniref:DUF4865 family protein n=1 Tax=Lentzea sp. TaxID=56099 RepID=UPI002CA93DB5|nr:DUF4865 family protein [Lentzea sp.]HUQ54166.1 DUF4865 family protein [Lentzea sp.]
MIAMQYEITLPSNYDMEIIRDRVRTRGHAMDAFEGLGFKAFLVRGTQYAPFYVWNTSAGMANFLYRGGGFQAILADFGRPVVQHWPGVAFLRGDAATAKYATRTITRLAPEANPIDVVGKIELEKAPGLHSAAVGVDPRTWEVVRFALWEEHPGEEGVYEVLHFSEPELGEITAG